MKNHSILLLAMMVLWIPAAAEAKYSGGTGTPSNPYRIVTPEDLNDIGNHKEDWDKHFILVNDVNMAQYTGAQFNIIGADWNNPFTGVFDGNDHKVWNFTWSSTGRDDIGLFGRVTGQIKNLGMENIDVNAINGRDVGGLVGELWGGTITNCYRTGNVSGMHYVGGLVGNDNHGTITDCYSMGSVSGERTIGGLVGSDHYGMITDCYSTGSVSGNNCIGGLVGFDHFGMITNCYSTGNVSGTDYVGGLVGDNEYGGTLTNCYSSGSVSGTHSVGGLVGENWGGMITNCYSTGNVLGNERVGGLVGFKQSGTITNCCSAGGVSGNSSVGGLVGNSGGGTITNCYSTGSVLGNEHVGGLVGFHSGIITASFWDTQTSGQLTSGGGTGKTTAQMKTMSTFTDAGWNFVEIWGIGENQTYPFLLTDPAGDSNHDKKVDFADLAILASHWLEGPP